MIIHIFKPLLFMLPLLWLGCSDTRSKSAMKPMQAEVGVYTLSEQSVTLTRELPGRTKATLSSEIRPQVGGIIQARLFDEGAFVKKDTVLYQIDPSSYQAAFDEAKAALKNAEATLESTRLKSERYADLAKIDGVSQQDREDAQAAYLQAVATAEGKKASLQSARINLEYTKIKAPISGRIGTSSDTVGALVTAGQTTALATIRVLDPIYVDLTQSSTQLLKLRALLAQKGVTHGSAALSLKLEDGTVYQHSGTLQFQEIAVDESTGSVTLRATFPNPEGILLPGMYVRAVLDEAVDADAVLVPQQGVQRDPKGNATALIVTAENKVEKRVLTTDRVIDDTWLVNSGLNAGDRVIVEGSNKARVGDSVKAVDVTTTLGKAK
ncbi:efflux RND transporter periplasmic adaptor subunit [Sulfurospirillum diekertiae]|uniref:Efflux RND transporter periplasmic adaptor subunit n=1 Tax=Sulfurospirillum diekertiae TaxID=1854492 RepID=A0A6G9VRD3_9BACT|nr:efflux RND transporter periplasmic adaptor subunit [Sulfurospirillum diekertiae]QIR75511.1 efflux RND transporter periplasmic adaptor subunit [Sulfurospirillum diekertiae]QIR78162.1 efflux RND transporter periplasmic adaptor subunit [Sulfurospirillum diekertiae]